MRLPPALAPWAPQLAIFPTDIAIALGPAIRRLAAAIGDWPAHPEGDDGDPDGFDGLTRRGSYERLLASEWLFADELPEEFLRRAGAGEHTFLRLARPQRAAHRHSVVLFDAGPSQLGAPRLAHIAALIVLARRAASARARFTWGILQRPPESDGADITPKSLRGLLDARSAETATEAALDAWRAHVDRHWHAGDVWLVGPPRWERAAAAWSWSSLAVRDVYEPSTRQLDVQVRGPRRSPAHLTLELPPPDVCTRVLRNPTAPAVAPPVRHGEIPFADARDAVFSTNGQRLLARGADGSLVIYVVPGSAGAAALAPVRVPPEPGTIVSADHWGSRLVIAREHAGVLAIEERTKKGGRVMRRQPYLGSRAGEGDAPAPGPLGRCLRLGEDLLVSDARGRLCRLAIRDGAALTVPLALRVAAVQALPQGVAYVVKLGPERVWELVAMVKGRRHSIVLGKADAMEAYIAWDRQARDPCPPFAVSEDGRRFRLCRNEESVVVEAFGERVLGLFLDRGRGMSLVAAGAESGRLALLGPGWTHRLPDCPTRVRPVAFCAMSGRVALLRDDRELLVYSVARRAVVGRWIAP